MLKPVSYFNLICFLLYEQNLKHLHATYNEVGQCIIRATDCARVARMYAIILKYLPCILHF